MAHSVNIRPEKLLIRQGNATFEWRATCSCGWMEKSASEAQVKNLADKHTNTPHRS